jgi:hypothetical protein
MGQFIGTNKPDGYNTEEEIDREHTNLLYFFGGEYQSGHKRYVSMLGNATIFIMKALEIIMETGGSITSTPGEVRVWKVKNHDCSCESTNLTNACRSFVKDHEDRQAGILS